MGRQDILDQQDKLQAMFNARYKELRAGRTGDSWWIDHCDRLKVGITNPEWMRDHFNNYAPSHICLDNPEPADLADDFYWLLVPLELAERALTLGGIP